MCEIKCNCKCPYWNRCMEKTPSIRPVTRYNRLCKEYIEELFGGCMKYNPIFVESRELATDIYMLRTNKLGLNKTEALSEEGAVMECYQIFKETLDFAMSYEK